MGEAAKGKIDNEYEEACDRAHVQPAHVCEQPRLQIAKGDRCVAAENGAIETDGDNQSRGDEEYRLIERRLAARAVRPVRI